MIRPILLFVFIAFVAGGVGVYAASFRLNQEARRQRWIKFISYFAIVYSVLFVAAAGSGVFSAFVLLLVAGGGYEIHRALLRINGATRQARPERHARSLERLPHSEARKTGAIWTGYLLVSLGLVAFARTSSAGEAVYVYTIVVFFDGFSQVFGQLWGKRKIAGWISPGKTAEGAVGGLVAACLAGIALRGLLAISALHALAVCGGIALASFAGDLAASWIKRKCQVKDFGNILPGHGGILDRFDSLLAAGPAFLAMKHMQF